MNQSNQLVDLPIIVIIQTMRKEKADSQTRDIRKVTRNHLRMESCLQSGTVIYMTAVRGIDSNQMM